MNKIALIGLKFGLPILKSLLKKLDDQRLKDIATTINKRVDIPKIPEDAEQEIIYNSLKTSVETVQILIDLI